jgi:hypothetical protein
LTVLLLLLAGLLAAPRHPHAAERVARALAWRWAPACAGAATALVFLYVMGTLRPFAAVHDEAAYLLQARIFASGRWTGPPPPLPEFFEQFHVLVTPRLASKYPPGHSLLLVPGIWLGMPGLVPLLLNALSGALLFALARRLRDGATALAAWTVWVTSAGALGWLATYYSESTTTALWLACWWLLLRWREERRPALFCALAALVAWGGVTRPLTMLAFLAPVAVVVLVRTVREGRWRELALGAAVGLAVCALIPLWSARTLGDWRTPPYREYSRVYFPFDRPGLGPDSTPPVRELPPDMRDYHRENAGYRAAHVGATLPRAWAQRVRHTLRGAFRSHGYGGWVDGRLLLGAAALAGLAAAPAPLWVALGTGVLLTLAYLGFYHKPQWSLYYVETLPALALLAAVGVRALAGAYLRQAARGTAAGPALLVAVASLAIALDGAADVRLMRRMHAARTGYQREFAARLAAIPEPRAMVFVRYAPGHVYHNSLIENAPDWREARVWVARDRGPDNLRLMAVDPARAGYLYDEASRRMIRIHRPPGGVRAGIR